MLQKGTLGKTLQANFDLEEFLAYLLNGSLLLVALNQYVPLSSLVVSIEVFEPDTLAQNVVNTLVFGAAAILGGHISSTVSRYVVRHLTWRFVDRPRIVPFTTNENSFWSDNLREALAKKAADVFGGLDVELTPISTPRLIRSYVISHSAELSEIRTRIVRARSLCANAVFPVILFSGGFFWDQNYIAGLIVACCAILLIVKQHDLDGREWKEIYLGFLAL